MIESEPFKKKSFNLKHIGSIKQAKKILEKYKKQSENKIAKRKASVYFFGRNTDTTEPVKRIMLIDNLLSLIDSAELHSLYEAIMSIERVRFGKRKLADELAFSCEQINKNQQLMAMIKPNSKKDVEVAENNQSISNKSDALVFKPKNWTGVLPVSITGSKLNFDYVLTKVHRELVHTIAYNTVLLDFDTIKNFQPDQQTETIQENMQSQYSNNDGYLGLVDFGRGVSLRGIKNFEETPDTGISLFLNSVSDSELKRCYAKLIRNYSLQAMLADLGDLFKKYFSLPADMDQVALTLDANEEYFLNEDKQLCLSFIGELRRSMHNDEFPYSVVMDNETGQLVKTEIVDSTDKDDLPVILKAIGSVKFKFEINQPQFDNGYIEIISATDEIITRENIEGNLNGPVRNLIEEALDNSYDEVLGLS